MRSLLFTLILSLIPLSAPSLSWGMTDAEAINVSGRQRMLSQRMMKSYLMLGADVKPLEARQQLNDAVALFESQFLALRLYAPSSEINKKLNEVEAIWLVHREHILGTPDHTRVPHLMHENLELLRTSNEVVQLIEAHSGKASGELVNVSGRQRMLSQKIAKTYVAMYWQVDNPDLRSEFFQAIDLFDQSLARLESSDLNTAELTTALTKVRNQWKFSQSGFRLRDDGQFVPTIITITTDNILRQMDYITGLYESVMNNQPVAQPLASVD